MHLALVESVILEWACPGLHKLGPFAASRNYGTDNFDSGLVKRQSALRLQLLVETGHFEVGVIVVLVQLNHSLEKFGCLCHVLRATARLDLGQHSECLVTVFEFSLRKNCFQVLLCGLKISQVVLDFGHAEMTLKVGVVVLETCFKVL